MKDYGSPANRRMRNDGQDKPTLLTWTIARAFMPEARRFSLHHGEDAFEDALRLGIGDGPAARIEEVHPDTSGPQPCSILLSKAFPRVADLNDQAVLIERSKANVQRAQNCILQFLSLIKFRLR